MIVRYKPKQHYKAIASWFHAHGLEAPVQDRLPEVGFIVDNRVAGWIYRTDSTVAMIDWVISNPFTLPSERRMSLKKLAGVLVDTAVALGYPDVIFTTTHENIKKIGVDMGFRPTNQQVFILDAFSDDEDTLNQESDT
jgi:hypothetical protein